MAKDYPTNGFTVTTPEYGDSADAPAAFEAFADSLTTQIHPTTISDQPPSGGNDGDVWFQYTP